MKDLVIPEIDFDGGYLKNIDIKIPEFIIDEETGENIKAKTVVKNKIPRQMPKDSATAMLQSVGPAAKSTMNSFMVGNLAL